MDRDSVKPFKELLDSVRDIDGFPIGKDEDILALSDPPFYTACPNPYIRDFIEEYGTPYDPKNDDYHREPFVGDISEGKGAKLYRAHSYHTKVPPKAIEKFIDHYTDQGDIVFDGFCGSGMTGIACHKTKRKAILMDLSPAATFIAKNYNQRTEEINEIIQEVNRIYQKIFNEYGWMYKSFPELSNQRTLNLGDIKHEIGNANYHIWSNVLICPFCKNEFVFWNAAINSETHQLNGKFNCPYCLAEITKKGCEFVREKIFDNSIGKEIDLAKYVPIEIDYSFQNKRYKKKPDVNDLEILTIIDTLEIPYWFPVKKLPKGDNTNQPIKSHGVSNIHHFYTKRSLFILSLINEESKSHFLKFILTSLLSMRCTKRMPFRPNANSVGSVNNLYLPSLFQEYNVIDTYLRKAKKIISAFEDETFNEKTIISTNSCTDLSGIIDNTIDYIFTDPPFGSNIMYSELSLFWESWIKVMTNNKKEAIMNKSQNKDLDDYAKLMELSFQEYYRVLKPNRWITVEFHNSKASVWNAIQVAMVRAGFIIAQVSTLDKKLGSFKQVTASGSVKNDLIINAYKPKLDFSYHFLKNAGEGMEVDFVSQQLDQLPVRPNIERTEKMLYSKMLAHYVENGFRIEYNSTNFYKLLSDNFTELDGYWFIDLQVKEYNKWKSGLSLDELREKLSGQQVILITDEKSALTWMYYFLAKPRTYSDIYTEYQQVATTTDDAIPELKALLENNFIREDGTYRRPLGESEKAEVEMNQEKELDRAFNKLLKRASDGKGKIKNVRREALLHGFTKCYQEGRYQDILTVAEKLYKSTLESSGEMMDFIDIARIKTAGENNKTLDEY